MSASSVLLLASMIGGSLPCENTGFVRGHVFVSYSETEACFHEDFREWIVEIDPETGEWSVFADIDDGLCVVNGLRFTPDGARLLAANAGTGRILAFAPDGSGEVFLDSFDGLNGTYGANCLAFDRGGDLYVVSTYDDRIMRFPDAAPPAIVFADDSDGISDGGALDFHPSGDLFYTTAGVTLRIDPLGQASVFVPRGSQSLAIDPAGNLFVATGGGVVRYDGPGPDPNTRRLFWQPPQLRFSAAIALSPGDEVLYFAQGGGYLHAIDPVTGASELVADFSELSDAFSLGATVYAPDPDLIPGRCCFELHSASPSCLDGVTRLQCGDTEPGPVLFTPKESCPPQGPGCETITGACCDADAFGGCADDTLNFECQCPTCLWHQNSTCGDVACMVTAIPAASAWGLTTMTLSLMIGAKIIFGQVSSIA